MSKKTSQVCVLTLTTSLDYVSVVIGIFAILLSIYWMVYGKTFEGPVSTRLSRPHLWTLGAKFCYSNTGHQCHPWPEARCTTHIR